MKHLDEFEEEALDGYRSGRLSRIQVARVLGFDWTAAGEFLARHGCTVEQVDPVEEEAAWAPMKRYSPYDNPSPKKK